MAHRVTIEGGCLYKSATDCSCRQREIRGQTGRFLLNTPCSLIVHCAYCRTTGNLGNLGTDGAFPNSGASLDP
jgi:hypothetical protein